MDVLIKGMEMPTEGTVIAIYKLSGQFYASMHGTELCPLVPIPPHGRLIDADVLFDFILNIYKSAQGEARKAYSDVLDVIVATGDVIPAEEG